MGIKTSLGPFVLVLAHCGSSPTLVTPTVSTVSAPDGGLRSTSTGGADDAAPPVAVAPLDPQSHPDASPDACAPHTADDPDDMGTDTNCDGADGVVGLDVYVDPTVGLDTSAGTPANPLRTLPAALSLASARSGHVLVASGTLTGDSLSVPGSWAAFGGYSKAFLGAPQRGRTILQPSAAGLFVDQAIEARLAHFTILADGPSDPGHRSAHALRSAVKKLVLDDMDIEAADGASGTNGDVGTSGEDPGGFSADASYAATCHGSPKPGYALGTGTYGQSPDGVTATGSLSAGVAAQQAQAGIAGTDGDDASGAIRLESGWVVGGLGTAGLGNGWFGYAGAAGGSGIVSSGPYAGASVQGGDGGRGGCPGGGGSPATSGGSSVGLVVLGGEVDLTRSLVRAGLGGTGGDGGDGGRGGHGGWGFSPVVSGAPMHATVPPSCVPSNDPFGINCAAYGGQGGEGGAGGRGGAGAGGWTVAILSASTATYTTDAATSLMVGKPGIGGLGNGGGWGAAGQARHDVTLSH